VSPLRDTDGVQDRFQIPSHHPTILSTVFLLRPSIRDSGAERNVNMERYAIRMPQVEVDYDPGFCGDSG